VEVLTPEAMAERVNFARPLHQEKEVPTESMWCIPFEYGSNAKGTRISISKAREIQSNLRADIAEAEKRELRREYDREKERGDESRRASSAKDGRLFELQTEVAILKQQLRKARKRKGK
jgi:hypothetical protein